MSGASRRRTSSRRQRRRSGGSLHHSGLSGGVAASVFEVGSSSGVGDAVDDENAFGVDVDVVRLEADVRWEQVDVAALGSDVVGAMADFVEEQADAMGVQLFHSASPSQLGLPSIAAASNGDSEDPDLQSTSEDSGDNQEDVEDSKDFKFVYQDEAWNQTFLTYVLGHLGFIGISSSNVHWRMQLYETLIYNWESRIPLPLPTLVEGRAYQPRRNVCAIPARKISFNRALYYIVCQCLGVICDLGIVKGFQPDFYQAVGGGTNSVAHGYTKGDGLGAEIIDTFVLVYVVFATTNKKHKARDSHVPALVPLPIEFAVYLVHLATIPIIGTIINLARSLGLAIIFNTQHNSYADHELELIRHTAKVQV